MTSKQDTWKALVEPVKKGCFNCEYLPYSMTEDTKSYEKTCSRCHEYEPGMMGEKYYQEINWVWNKSKHE